MLGDDDETTRVAAALGHTFEEPALLHEALTHRSLANERTDRAVRDNERLEFLGDAVLGFVVATLLSEEFPAASEGELTRRRADLVCESSLAAIARELGLGRALRLGRGEERTGGREKPRLLASALEACVGAVYRDAGAEAAGRVARRLFAGRVTDREPGAEDHKSRVQELVQALGRPAPRYELVRAEGPDHDRVFHVAVHVGESVLGGGSGRSKLEAEQAAALVALGALRREPDA